GSGMAHDAPRMLAELRKYIEPPRRFAVASGVTVAGALLQLALSILIAFFFFRDGDEIVARLRTGIARIAGDHGGHLAGVAVGTGRGGVLGILGSALVQGVLAGLGFGNVGIRAAPLLGFVPF